MQIQDDFSELHLFFNQPITFTIFDDEQNQILTTFSMSLPTFQQLQFDTKFRLFLNFLNTDLEVLQKHFIIFPDLVSHFGLLRRMLNLPDIFQHYIELFMYTCNLLHIPLQIKEFEYIINNVTVTYNLFQLIMKYIQMSCGLNENISDNTQLNKYAKKIAEIKAKNELNNQDSLTDSFLDVIVGIMYEFKISRQELLNSTMYFIQTIGTYYGHIIQHQISLIGAGNGLSKKIYNISRRKQL